jgi:hypothetical protein
LENKKVKELAVTIASLSFSLPPTVIFSLGTAAACARSAWNPRATLFI